LDNNFNELDQMMSDEVLNASWWEAEALHVSAESREISLTVSSDSISGHE
jgi:hypothetical protein